MALFSNLFKRKHRPPASASQVLNSRAQNEEAVLTSTPVSHPASDLSTGMPASRTERAPRIFEYSDLPAYDGILSAEGELLAVPEIQQKEFALLNAGDATVILVATDKFFGSSQYLTLVARAEHASLQVIASFIADDSAIIALIYEKARRNISNKQSETQYKAESVQLFEAVISEAIRRRATDVHFIIGQETGIVKFRVDGRLRKFQEYPSSMLTEAVGVAYTKLAEESSRSHPSFNARFPQSCSIVLNDIAGRSLNLRYQSLPVVGGADVVLRLLYTDDSKRASPTLESLGYASSQQRQLVLATRKTVGAIVVAGITGSGKSTTLKTVMTMNPERHLWKQYSVEDPAEYVLPGISQISVQRKAEATTEGVSANPFVAAMRTLMRADPDEIMVGEVRDSETGSLLKTMVHSGHQVYTSIHAISAIEIVERMTSEEIGMSRQTLSSRNFISALIYQRLLATNCAHCCQAAETVLSDDYLCLVEKKFGLNRATLKVASADGCAKCDGAGLYGQTVVAEIIVPDAAILKHVREGRDIEAEELWRSRRTAAFTEPNCDGKTAFEHGLYKVSEGLVDPRILEDAFEPFESYQLMAVETGADSVQ